MILHDDRGVRSESGLPGGGQADRGLSLDPDIPGVSTFAKPVDDIRDDKADEGSIYKKEGPKDLAKKQNNPEGDQRQNEWLEPRYTDPGGRPQDDTSITKYPYRDDMPNAHNASAEFVAGLYRVAHAHVVVLSPTSPVKIASTGDEILSKLNRKFKQRAKTCASTLKRVDAKNLRWIFSVNCGHGPKVVKVKAIRNGNIVEFSKLDLELSCSCPAWQWLGPEYHAVTKDYQLGKPVGTASTPDIRDPRRVNKVCKHVASVLAATKGWSIPKTAKPKRK